MLAFGIRTNEKRRALPIEDGHGGCRGQGRPEAGCRLRGQPREALQPAHRIAAPAGRFCGCEDDVLTNVAGAQCEEPRISQRGAGTAAVAEMHDDGPDAARHAIFEKVAADNGRVEVAHFEMHRAGRDGATGEDDPIEDHMADACCKDHAQQREEHTPATALAVQARPGRMFPGWGGRRGDHHGLIGGPGSGFRACPGPANGGAGQNINADPAYACRVTNT